MSSAISANAINVKQPSIIGGAMIVAGTSIGAGMFALPVAGAGMWFSWSLILLAVIWFAAYSSSQYLAEASLNYKKGASYATIAEDTMGPTGKVLATLSVGFVCYIISYAYVSGGSSIVAQTVSSTLGFDMSHSAAALLFGVVLASIVMVGSRAVDRITTIMIGGMVLTFFGSTTMLTGSASAENLFPGLSLTETSPYVWLAIPVLVTSFGFHGTVPSLVKHFNQDAGKVRLSLLWGTLLTLVIYLFWQLAIMGNVSRDEFGGIIEQGGNVGTLVAAVGGSIDATSVEAALAIFGNLALASSFLGVTLGLVDFLKDLFKLDDSLKSSLLIGAMAFLPPILGGAIFPYGFIMAIGYAGLAATLFILILPAMMALVLRQRGVNNGFRTRGGNTRLYAVLGFGVLALLVAIGELFGMFSAFSG